MIYYYLCYARCVILFANKYGIISVKACEPYAVTILSWATIFKWYLAKFV